MFNPETFSYSASNAWSSPNVPGQQTTAMFEGGASGSFSLDLLFDTTDTGKSVTKHTNKIMKLLEVDESVKGYSKEKNNGRPQWIKFHWGKELVSWKAVITQASVTFTYFSAEGTPLRADVAASLMQFEPEGNWGPQNPTSGTPTPHKSHQVQVGDTLDRIAARHFGDATKWRDIATLNGIEDPLNLHPGMVLSIPENWN